MMGGKRKELYAPYLNKLTPNTRPNTGVFGNTWYKTRFIDLSTSKFG